MIHGALALEVLASAGADQVRRARATLRGERRSMPHTRIERLLVAGREVLEEALQENRRLRIRLAQAEADRLEAAGINLPDRSDMAFW